MIDEPKQKPNKHLMSYESTHELISAYGFNHKPRLGLPAALDKLVRLGIKADKAQKGMKKK